VIPFQNLVWQSHPRAKISGRCYYWCRYCIPLGETRKLLQQSRKIVDEADDSTNISVLLNTILKLVSSIDVRLQGVEKSVGKFDEIKTIITSLSSRIVSVEKNIINCQAKITEVENSVQGVGNLFDNLKSDCDKNNSEITKLEKSLIV
jgi:peptidoglycan hydrolase CwlO-like protein